MARSFDTFKDLDITRDEVERFGEALKDKEFRKLLNEYVEELQNPENQKVYQQEITKLEKERGYDVTFINPTAGYVIKTSVDGNKKAFVNICTNANIQKPSSKCITQNGSKGLQWSLPHSLTPPREDIDKKGNRCQVFDVVFHPDTLYLAQNNKAFLNMVNNTACSAIEENFNTKLDVKNLKFPKMQYKGMAHAAVIRREAKEKLQLSSEEQEIMDKVYKSMPKVEKQSPKKTKVKKVDNDSKYTAPTYVIKHRSLIDLEEFTEHKNAKLNSAIPKELVVEVNLPLLRSANDIVLDVMEKSIQLISEKPSKYRLYLTLPYSVDENAGNAKFDKDTKKLIITLPVRRMEISSLDINRDDSGVDSDHGSPLTGSPTEDIHTSTANLISVLSENVCEPENNFRTKVNSFLEEDTHYSLPEYSCHVYANILAFTLHVKNVDETTLCKILEDHTVHLKFATISSGFYPINYAFYVKLENHHIDCENISIEVWDNNVVAQLPFQPSDNVITTYFIGIDRTTLQKKVIEDPSVISKTLEDSIKQENHNEEITETTVNEAEEEAEETNEYLSEENLDSGEESSGDELSYSYSPKDGEVSTSLKKTVRFNDVVLKQLYRSNSSILGQKKKNQRKARNKKRAQERRHSESELSEIEDRKEGDMKTIVIEENKTIADTQIKAGDDKKQSESNNDIFDLDI
ncbi:hypothetical protein Trydic_g12626 [Trypoxylus dichotomus]